MARVRFITPPFAALYAPSEGSTQNPLTDAMLTIDPPPSLRILGIAARAHR